MTVTALLVSHDGARWLPAVLEGLDRQSIRPDRIVAVDTGSSDASVDLLRVAFGEDAVLTASGTTSYGAALELALRNLPTDQVDAGPEWLWLLHDDSAPAPDALEHLLAAARSNPSAAVLGPKLREWPSLRRLLEVGVTISGTGLRETGLERGEYDQGQHDRLRDVLAVNTAGMLVRRDAFEQLGGLDPWLPMFGNDIDFGWRAARAGLRTLVAPDAVVFHAEAARRGVRRTPVTTNRPRRAERRAALYTLLVNGSLLALPFRLVRLILGSLLRALGLLLVRAPGEAWDELVALLQVYLRPDRLIAGRAARRRSATVAHQQVRHLLAPPWLPYRHGLDFLTDVGSAVALQARDVSARRGRRVEGTETGPVPAEAQNLPADTGLVARLSTSPVAVVSAVLVVLSLAAARGVLGPGMLSGGALLPAPDSAGAWWQTYLQSWHVSGTGSGAPAGPFLLPLAMAGTLLLGKAWLVVDLMFLLAVPLATWGGYRFLRTVTGARMPSLWGAVAFGLLPVLSGAVNQGRLGTVAAALVLPWLAHSALFLRPGESPDRRWRAAWRSALWLALLSAFVPVAWALAVVLGLVAGAAVVARTGAGTRFSVWGPLLVPLAVVPLLLLPWSLTVLTDGTGAAKLLFEAGLADVSLGAGSVTGWDLVTGRPGSVGDAPGWLSIGIAVAAVAALLRNDTRPQVLRAWVVLVLALVPAAALAGRVFTLPSGEAAVWIGFWLLVVHAAGITAAVIAANGITAMFSGSSFGWRQPVALVVVVAGVLSPLAGLVWWTVSGISGPLDRRPVTSVPTYMAEAAAADPVNGVLVLRGAAADGLEYTVLRGDGARLGDETIAPTAEADESLTEVVAELATAARAEDVAALSRHGVRFIYAPESASSELVENLDSVSGLSRASATRPSERAWQLEAKPTDEALTQPSASIRPWLLGLQGIALVVVAILAAPSRKVRR